MVLIFLSWLYIFLTSTAVGIGILKLFSISYKNATLTSILGLAGVTICAGTWAFLGPIAVAFHAFLIVLTVVLLFFFWSDFLFLVKSTKKELLSFTLGSRLVLLFISLLALAQSATSPFTQDNETYYVQTIKWLNEYGFVPGLANLHIFLGQCSGWHITQSAYSFSFIYSSFNDLNGYCFLLLNFWSFQKIHSFYKKGDRLDLAFGLLPLAYLFLFQFINSPMPDFGVYVLAFLIFDLYLKNDNNSAEDNFKLILIFVLFAVYIKITAILLLLLPVFVFLKNFKVLKSNAFTYLGLSLFFFVLWIGKNSVLSGCPLYPSTLFRESEADFTVPEEIMDYFFSGPMRHSFYMPFGSYQDASLLYFVKQYFFSGGIDSLIGMATLLIVIIIPFILYNNFRQKSFWQLYSVFLLVLLTLAISSPQYRFYVYFTLFFGLLFLATFLKSKKVITMILGLSITLTTISVFVPLSFSFLTSNVAMSNNQPFNTENVVFPQPNSKIPNYYKVHQSDKLKYYSPEPNPENFWTTGNGPLPCVTEEQIRYFETNFRFYPQMRRTNLQQGFYSQRIK